MSPSSSSARARALSHAQRVVAVALCCAFVASGADAHVSNAPIDGDAVLIRTDGAPADHEFSFSSTQQGDLVIDTHDFTQEPTGVLVRGDGSTGLIDLDPASWSPVLGDGDAVEGYTYDDPSGSRGGIQSIHYDRVQGSLSIEGGGANWPWSPAGPQTEVWVHFHVEDEWFCAKFADGETGTGATVTTNVAGHYEATGAGALASCPSQVCGNAIHEVGEACDDGNLSEDDSCSNTCEEIQCQSTEYATTYDAIQDVIFDGVYGCSFGFCHGSSKAGGLDLRAGASYDALVGIPAQQFVANQEGLERVVPGEPAASFLFHKLDGAVNGGLDAKYQGVMPVGGALSPEHLEAVRKWIRGGAPRDLVVEETAELLGACLPPIDPLKIDAPEHPGPGVGVQLQQTAYLLPDKTERELCMATWYDFTQTDLIPEDFQVDCPDTFGPNNPSNKCFMYHRTLLLQDPQSHHSIIHIYQGLFGPRHVDEESGRGFGPWTFKTNDLEDPRFGEECDPLDVDPALGYNPDCSGIDRNNIACLGTYGPPDFNTGANAPTFGGSQEPYADNPYAPGVFSVLPMSGVVVWNSHAFNLTEKDTSMAQYYNIYLAGEEDRKYFARGIFDARYIFDQRVRPYETQELCATYTLPIDGDNIAHLFDLSSHTHRFGNHFRIWEPPNAPCSPNGQRGLPVCPGPGPDERLIYSSRDYSDPAVLVYEPPLVLDSTNPDDRTYLYCSVYDNGSTPESPPVKRASQINGGSAQLSRCRASDLYCMGGPNNGMACGTTGFAGDDSLCDSFEGAGDGQCDACTVKGGVTTEDEMFILLGSYYMAPVPEPSAGALAVGAFATLAALARRRARRAGGRA